MPRARVYQGKLRFPGVVTPPEPPPEPTIYGPTAGAAAIRAGAGARTVTDPGGGVSFTSPADFVTKLAANPNGTVFVAANSMTWSQQVTPGVTKAPKIYIPTGRVINGNGFAGSALVMSSGELHGGEFTNFGGDLSSALAAQGTDQYGASPGVLMQDIICHDNNGKGFNSACSNSIFDHCTTYSNGRYGFGAQQTQGLGQNSYNTNVTFRYIKCYNNNTRNLATNNDAGGNKILHCNPTYVSFSWFYSNTGAGLWMDFNHGAHIVEENVMELNTWWGFFYEMGASYPLGDSTFVAELDCHNNLIKDNVSVDTNSWYNSVDLLSSCSDGQVHGGTGYEFHHNIVDTTHRAMGFVDHNSHPGDVKSCLYRENDVWLRGTRTGCVGGQVYTDGTQPQGDPYSVAYNNHFVDNHYHVAVGQTTAAKWRWQSLDKTWTQWRALGHDLNGTLVTY